MTSSRQFEANRRNATRSTGPITEAGKDRSRRNAIRHGLCAETVVGTLEDVEDYKGFEAAIIADYDAETALERELVLRLASLLWRIRRATSIETELFRIQAEILQERRLDRPLTYLIFGVTNLPDDTTETLESVREDGNPTGGHHTDQYPTRSATHAPKPTRDLAHCFQRLANLDSAAVEQLGRYERALSRQLAQTLFLLRQEKRSRRASQWRDHPSRTRDRSF
jgi:hypothetical protein